MNDDNDQAARLDAEGNLHLGRRCIPLPSSVSPQARSMLAMPRLEMPARPAPDATEEWRRRIEMINTSGAPRVAQMLDLCEGRARIETRHIAGVVVHVATPVTPRPGREHWLRIAVHGGALIYFGGAYARAEAGLLAMQSGCEAWSVDYRVPPDHPFPAAIEDVVAVYGEALRHRGAARIALSGASAGGNIAAAAVLAARERGMTLPAALGLFTPQCDLTESGDSFFTNQDIDNALPGRLAEEIALYANGADLRQPLLSPLFADFSRGFPASFIQTGTRDLFLSNSVRMHRALRAAGISAELHVWEAMPHGGFGFDAPEMIEMQQEFDRFLSRQLS